MPFVSYLNILSEQGRERYSGHLRRLSKWCATTLLCKQPDLQRQSLHEEEAKHPYTPAIFWVSTMGSRDNDSQQAKKLSTLLKYALEINWLNIASLIRHYKGWEAIKLFFLICLKDRIWLIPKIYPDTAEYLPYPACQQWQIPRFVTPNVSNGVILRYKRRHTAVFIIQC